MSAVAVPGVVKKFTLTGSALGAGIANSAGGDGASGLVAPPPAFDAAVLALVAAGYLHYVLGVISETCAYLGIQCLTIKPVVALVVGAAVPAWVVLVALEAAAWTACWPM